MINKILKTNVSLQSVFCAGLTTMILAGCGEKKSDDSPAPATQTVQAPVLAQPTPSPIPTQIPPTATPAVSVDGLAVEIKNRASIDGKTLQSNSVSVEFGLKNGQQQVAGISYRCVLETADSKGQGVSSACTSPKVIQVQQAGQYYLTVFAVQDASQQIGNPTQLSFVVGGPGQNSGQGGQGNGGQGNGGFGGGSGGFGGGQSGGGIAAPTAQQVGDMFAVNVPQGFHMIYRSSTFDTPGRLNFQFINGGAAVDSAAPYAYDCLQTPSQFQTMQTLRSGSGQAIPYCNMSPSIAFNSPAHPIFNSFRWDNMSMISYNAMAIASDSSLGNTGMAPGSVMQPSMAKLYTNVFTNVTGASNDQFQNMFATELNATVSRLNIACAGQQPQYLGNAAIFQGYFSFSLASAPLFGCLTQRNLQWYVEIAAFPIDTNMQILPQQGWGQWIGQSFANKRAAEIVVELGPYPQAVLPISVAPDAQNLMVQNIKKLLPSAIPTGNGIPAPGFSQNGTFIPPFNH